MFKVVALILFLSVFNVWAQVRRPLSPLGDTGFSVRKATEDFRAVSRVHFQDILTNLGGGWHSGRSEFEAPFNGVYFFIFHAVSDRNSDFQIDLIKNRDCQVSAYGTEGSFQHASNSVLLELRKGDIIYLEISEGKIYEHRAKEAYTTFSGFLLFKF